MGVFILACFCSWKRWWHKTQPAAGMNYGLQRLWTYKFAVKWWFTIVIISISTYNSEVYVLKIWNICTRDAKKSLLILLLPMGGIFLCFLEETVRWEWYWHCICRIWMFGCTVGCMLSSGLRVLCRSSILRPWSKNTSVRLFWNSQLPSVMSVSEWWGWGDLSRVEFCISTTGSESGTPGSWKGKKVQCLASQQECPGFKSPLGQGHFRVFWLPPTAQRHIFGDRQIGVWEWMVVCSKLAGVRGVDDLLPEGRWDLLQLLPRSPNGGGCVDLKHAGESSQ